MKVLAVNTAGNPGELDLPHVESRADLPASWSRHIQAGAPGQFALEVYDLLIVEIGGAPHDEPKTAEWYETWTVPAYVQRA